MNRNNEKFSMNPQIEKPRSQFAYNSGLHTTFNAGVLVPIYCDDVLPGDTWSGDVASCIRMSSPLFPTMDNAYLDTYFFFVPDRLSWNRSREFHGETTHSNWNPSGSPWYGVANGSTLLRPHVKWRYENNAEPHLDESGYARYFEWTDPSKDPTGSLIDYFGLPIINLHDNNDPDSENYDDAKTNSFDMLPFEAYNLIWNNFFRDQNSMEPCPLKLQDTSDNDMYHETGFYMGTDEEYFRPNTYDLAPTTSEYELGYGYLLPKPACKFHDYFTAALPNAQKGSPVPINAFAENMLLPVVAGPEHDEYIAVDGVDGMLFNWYDTAKYGNTYIQADTTSGTTHARTLLSRPGSGTLTGDEPVLPTNMYASATADSMPNVNDLRLAFAVQRVLEADARGGNLYADLVYSHFGVENPDARVQLPEYLGGSRVMINMQQVVQTSETGDTPQGNVSGLSVTNATNGGFTKSFTEHGIIIGLAVVRCAQSYQSGINKRWSKRNRFDYYTPELANIGEQPILMKELCCGAAGGLSYAGIVMEDDDQTFGFNEAWAEYRYKPNQITGLMRSHIKDSLDAYHYSEAFHTRYGDAMVEEDRYPHLDSDFLAANSRTLDRSLTFSHELEPQFLADFAFRFNLSRCMPLHSVPGLIDHY